MVILVEYNRHSMYQNNESIRLRLKLSCLFESAKDKYHALADPSAP